WFHGCVVCPNEVRDRSATGRLMITWLGGQTPPIPIVLRVGVECEAPGIVGHQHNPAPRNFFTMNIAQLNKSAFRTRRIPFVPDELALFCFLGRVRALLHVRYPIPLLDADGCESLLTVYDPLPPTTILSDRGRPRALTEADGVMIPMTHET